MFLGIRCILCGDQIYSIQLYILDVENENVYSMTQTKTYVFGDTVLGASKQDICFNGITKYAMEFYLELRKFHPCLKFMIDYLSLSNGALSPDRIRFFSQSAGNRSIGHKYSAGLVCIEVCCLARARKNAPNHYYQIVYVKGDDCR